MLPSDDAPRWYTRPAVLLHWVVAALVIAQFTWGWWMQQIPKQPPGLRADAYNLHKSIGLVILALMLVRLGWRAGHPPPALDGLPAWQRRSAWATHALLYAVLFVMPLAGYLGSVFSGYPVKWFGVRLPGWGWNDPALKTLMSSVHFTASWILIGATLLHVAAALRHALARDGYNARLAWTPSARGRAPQGPVQEGAEPR